MPERSQPSQSEWRSGCSCKNCAAGLRAIYCIDPQQLTPAEIARLEQISTKTQRTRQVWLVTLPGTIGPIALLRAEYPRTYAEAGWTVEGPMVPMPVSDADLKALEDVMRRCKACGEAVTAEHTRVEVVQCGDLNGTYHDVCKPTPDQYRAASEGRDG